MSTGFDAAESEVVFKKRQIAVCTKLNEELWGC